jgi:hypothetical protein
MVIDFDDRKRKKTSKIMSLLDFSSLSIIFTLLVRFVKGTFA